jgi:hypothetical protein
MTNYEPVLLNAEPFGFGPAAAIAVFAAQFERRGVPVGYIGKGHTHDLQRTISYRDRYDLSGISPQTEKIVWAKAAKKYKVFLTAMDFTAATAAKAAGMQVIIYDALAWYWPELPQIVKQADLYLPQKFFGVKARVAAELPLQNVACVAPIVRPKVREKTSSQILLNLGGLQNPYWQVEDAVSYAKTIVRAVRAACGSTNVVVATSQAVATLLADQEVKTYSVAEIQQQFSHSTLAIMTPGLGNIYDAAAFDLPTIWLPPANDSQAQQITMLASRGCADATLGWEDLGLPLDIAAPQIAILQEITQRVRQLHSNVIIQRTLQKLLVDSQSTLAGRTASNTNKLLQLFGWNGTATVVHEVLTYLEACNDK